MFTIQLHVSVQMTPQHNLFKLLTSHIVEVLQLIFGFKKAKKTVHCICTVWLP